MTVPANIPAPMMAAAGIFPIVEATSTGGAASDDTSHNITLPSGIVAGDLLIVCVSSDAAPGFNSWSGGFTEFFEVANSTLCSLGLAYKLAVGGETTISVGLGSSQKIAYTAYRISGAINPSSQVPEASTGATGTSTTPNPDAVTPTGGAKGYLFIAVQGHDNARTTDGFPSGYTNSISAESSVTGATGIGSTEKTLTASSENPGTFTISASDDWVAATIAIHPE